MGFVDCVIYMVDETNSELVQRAAMVPKYCPINKIPIGKDCRDSCKTGEAEIVSDTTKDKGMLLMMITIH